jgi:hypothetical protein
LAELSSHAAEVDTSWPERFSADPARAGEHDTSLAWNEGTRGITMQQVELDLAHDNFFCPVTGERILGPESFAPSPATAFVFTPESGEFETIQEGLAEIDRKVNTEEVMEEDPWGRFDRFCKELKGRPDIVVFSITTRGMACGPVSSTVHIGIDMNYRGGA